MTLNSWYITADTERAHQLLHLTLSTQEQPLTLNYKWIWTDSSYPSNRFGQIIICIDKYLDTELCHGHFLTIFNSAGWPWWALLTDFLDVAMAEHLLHSCLYLMLLSSIGHSLTLHKSLAVWFDLIIDLSTPKNSINCQLIVNLMISAILHHFTDCEVYWVRHLFTPTSQHSPSRSPSRCIILQGGASYSIVYQLPKI